MTDKGFGMVELCSLITDERAVGRKSKERQSLHTLDRVLKPANNEFFLD